MLKTGLNDSTGLGIEHNGITVVAVHKILTKGDAVFVQHDNI